MKKKRFFYENGSELLINDKVLAWDKVGYIETIFMPGSKKSSDYSCEEGGFVVVFESGDVQVWHDVNEDISLIQRQ